LYTYRATVEAVHDTDPARSRQRRRAGPAAELDPAVCRCPTGPLLIATFRGGDLVAVERRHWFGAGCRLGTERLDPADYGARKEPA